MSLFILNWFQVVTLRHRLITAAQETDVVTKVGAYSFCVQFLQIYACLASTHCQRSESVGVVFCAHLFWDSFKMFFRINLHVRTVPQPRTVSSIVFLRSLDKLF